MTRWLAHHPRLLWTTAAGLIGLNGAALTGYFPPATGNPVLAYIEDRDALAYLVLWAWLWTAPAVGGAALGAMLPDLAAITGLRPGAPFYPVASWRRHRRRGGRPGVYLACGPHGSRRRPHNRLGRLFSAVARAWHQPGP